MKQTINFKIRGRHENHRGEAIIVPDYKEGTNYMQNNLPGKVDFMKTRKIGNVDGYDIYENYYDPGSDDYGYFAIKTE